MLLQGRFQSFEHFIFFLLMGFFLMDLFQVISFQWFKRIVLQNFDIPFSCCIVGKPIVLPAFSSHPVNGSVCLNGSTSFQHWCKVDAVDLVFNIRSSNVGQCWKKSINNASCSELLPALTRSFQTTTAGTFIPPSSMSCFPPLSVPLLCPWGVNRHCLRRKQ